MSKRLAGALPAALLLLLLTGCGGGEGASEEGKSSGSSSASESSSESPSESPSEEAAAAATGEDYRALLSSLNDQQAKVQDVTSADQFNQKADFPEGVSVAEYDKAAKTLCLEDAGKDIALTFSSKEIVLHDGLCADGKDVSTLRPQGQDDIVVTGDKQLGAPVKQFFLEEFGS